MFKYSNVNQTKFILIGIIAVLIVIISGGIFFYQYYYIPKQESQSLNYIPQENTEKNTETSNYNTEQNIEAQTQKISETEEINFSHLDKDELLHKLFPNLTFTNGVANHNEKHEPYLRLYLENAVEDYFLNTKEKNLLLIVRLDGMGHAGGLYHAYLGLFDKKGNLLTPTSSYGGDNYDFFGDKAHFGGDEGEFKFYDCKGIKYIAFASAGCPNGTCCFGKVELFAVNKGRFEKIQTIDLNPDVVKSNIELDENSYYGVKMILSDEKIIAKKVPPTSDNGCPETYLKELKWNRNTCRFE